MPKRNSTDSGNDVELDAEEEQERSKSERSERNEKSKGCEILPSFLIHTVRVAQDDARFA